MSRQKSEKGKNDLYPSGSKPGVLYGLAKIHKALEDGTPSFRPILLAIGTPTYNVDKFYDQLLKSLTSNDYTIKDSFSFSKEILDFDASCFMASFDMKSLFTNIPLTETLNLCVQNLYRNQAHVKNLTKSSFYKLLKMTVFESFFVFGGKFNEYFDGGAMSFPLGPKLANVLMCHLKTFVRKTVQALEIETLKSILKHNSYPHNLVNYCIKKFFNKLFVQRNLNFMVPKMELICVLPYLVKASLDLRTRLRRTIERKLLFCKSKIIFRSKCRLNALSRFKNSLEKKICSGIFYRYTCSNCNVTCYGKTFRHFYTRVAEHMGFSNLTGKRLKNVKQVSY